MKLLYSEKAIFIALALYGRRCSTGISTDVQGHASNMHSQSQFLSFLYINHLLIPFWIKWIFIKPLPKGANKHENVAMLWGCCIRMHPPINTTSEKNIQQKNTDSTDKNEVWLWPDRKIIYVIQIEALKAFIDRQHRFSLCLHFYLA